MPTYFNLEDALVAARAATHDYKPTVSGGPKPESNFSQKPKAKEIIPPQKEPTKKPEPTPEPTPFDDSKLQARKKVLSDRYERLNKHSEAPLTDEELFREPPPLVVGAALVQIDDSRKHRQTIEGAEQVQQVKGQQNAEAKGFGVSYLTKKASEATTTAGKILTQSAANLANIIRHPGVTLQNMFVREPIEQREINFAAEVERRVKAKLFKDYPEIPMKASKELIKKAMDEGRRIRNETKGKQLVHALADASPLTTIGIFDDSQQRRALDWLNEQLAKTPDQYPEEIKRIRKETLDYLSGLGQRFALTLSKGEDALSHQERSNSHILFADEHRRQVESAKNAQIEKEVKSLLEPYVGGLNLTEEGKLKLIDDFNKIYLSQGLITEEQIKNGEFANNIIPLVEELTKDERTIAFYRRPENWKKLKIVSFIGDSHGDALGGAKKFTKNQEIALRYQDKKDANTLAAAGAYSAGAAVADTVGYLTPYLAATLISTSKAIPRSVTGAVTHAIPILGPLWAGAFGGTMESVDITAGGKMLHESRVTSQLRQTSRDKALLEEKSDRDYVRGELETATVTAVPAEVLTNRILELVLEDPKNLNSETKKNLDKKQVLDLFAALAHSRARLDLTMKSGSSDLDFKTQNWVSYNKGQEQKELALLKAANLQAYARLLNIDPALLAEVPFFAVNGGDIDATLKSFSLIIESGLKEGIAAQLIDNPLGDQKSNRFYQQIFEASGIPKSQIAEVTTFLTALKDDKTTIAGKNIYDWMQESDSFRARNRDLKRIKARRFILSATTAAVTSIGMSAAKYGYDTGVNALHQHFTPVATANAPTGQAAPEAQTQSFNLEPAFKNPAPGNDYQLPIWHDGAASPVHIPLAAGFTFKFDGKNYDLVNTRGDVVGNDFFISDTAHPGAYIPNPHFQANPLAQPVDLNNFFNGFSHGSEHTQGVVQNFWQKAADYRVTWAHSGHVQPDHDQVFATGDNQHPYGLEIHFKEDTVRNPNNGIVTSLSDHYADKSMSVLVEINGLLGDKPGQVLLKDCIVKNGNDYVLRLDPTSHDQITLADGTVTTMGQVAQILLNEQYLKAHPGLTDTEMKVDTMNALALGNTGPGNQFGHLLIGYTDIGDPKNHAAIPGNNQIFIPVHEVSGIGNMNTEATIETPGVDNPFTVYSPTPIVIPAIPTPAPVPAEVPVATPVTTANFTSFSGVVHSPQLNPVKAKARVTTATALPETVINDLQFKKEARPVRPTKEEDFKFIEDLVKHHSGPAVERKIDQYVLDHIFTKSQREFLNDKSSKDFIKVVDRKLENINLDELDDPTKKHIRDIVNAEAKAQGLENKEALLIYEYLIQRTFYENYAYVVKERDSIDRELKEIDLELRKHPPINNPPPPNPPIDDKKPIPPSPKPRSEEEVAKAEEEFIDNFILMQTDEQSEFGPEDLKKMLDNYVYYEMLTNQERVLMKPEKYVSIKDSLAQKFEDQDFISRQKDKSDSQLVLAALVELRLKLSTEEQAALLSYLNKTILIQDKIMQEIELREKNNPKKPPQPEKPPRPADKLDDKTRALLKEIGDDFISSAGNPESFNPGDKMVGHILDQMTEEKIKIFEANQEAIFDILTTLHARSKSGRISNKDSEDIFKQKAAQYHFGATQSEVANEFIKQYFVVSAYIQAEMEDIKATGKIPEWVEKSKVDADIKIDKKDLKKGEDQPSQLRKSFEEYADLTTKSNLLKKQLDQIIKRETGGGKDEFAYLSNDDFIRVNNEIDQIKKQIDESTKAIVDFETGQLPIILGGSFDTIVANQKDAISGQEVHGFYYNGFRDAFRQYMTDYINKGDAADSQNLKTAFSKIKSDLSTIDPSVKIVEFDDFKRGIISALTSSPP